MNNHCHGHRLKEFMKEFREFMERFDLYYSYIISENFRKEDGWKQG